VGLAVGILLSLVFFLTLRAAERREVQRQAADLAGQQLEKLRVCMFRSMEVLHSIVAWHAVQGAVEPETFRRFVQQALERQPELQALSWNPVVRHTHRALFEAEVAATGGGAFELLETDDQGTFRSAGEREFYVPVLYIEPLGPNARAVGYDLGSDPRRRESLERARDDGCPVATAPVQLAQGPPDEPGLLVLLPAYGEPLPDEVEERRRRLAGFAVAVFRVGALVRGILEELREQGIEASVFDGAPDGPRLYGGPGSPGGGKLEDAEAVAWLDVAGRRWAVVYRPTADFLEPRRTHRSWGVLGGGLAFSLLSAVHLWSGWRRTREVGLANAALESEIVVRERAEAVAAEASRAKSDFLASMSHEIRTPLNAILGYAQLMERDPRLAPEQRDAAAGIGTSGHHLLGLINEILDLSKIEAGRAELHPIDFDLVALAQGLAATFRPLCARKGIGFRLQVEGCGKGWVRSDEGKLRQVLFNLVGNAVKFTRVGEVVLRCGPTPSGQWLFEVIDSGLGIPEKEHAEIFKPFHQGSGAGHQGGTGLGLAIAQRQVELLGGRIGFQSERGIGSRFHFEIPMAAASVQGGPRLAPVVGLAAGQRVRALVVDDHGPNRQVLAGLLTSIGVEVDLAVSGEEALERVKEVAHDIIFLDWLLPGLSGAETLRALLATSDLAPPRIVVHTASPLAHLRDEAMAAGCVDFMAKPFSCERLFQSLEDSLGVTLERAETSNELEAPVALKSGAVTLPAELCSRLVMAADVHSATALKDCLPELRALGPEANRLAEDIRWLLRSFDMTGIQRLLTRVSSPSASEQTVS
jgi:signal transduction histidine kinase/CheY-like chemotaxis protein